MSSYRASRTCGQDGDVHRLVTAEQLNWMLPNETRAPFTLNSRPRTETTKSTIQSSLFPPGVLVASCNRIHTSYRVTGDVSAAASDVIVNSMQVCLLQTTTTAARYTGARYLFYFHFLHYCIQYIKLQRLIIYYTNR